MYVTARRSNKYVSIKNTYFCMHKYSNVLMIVPWYESQEQTISSTHEEIGKKLRCVSADRCVWSCTQFGYCRLMKSCDEHPRGDGQKLQRITTSHAPNRALETFCLYRSRCTQDTALQLLREFQQLYTHI